jgi:redox-sensitive bicupin YhaK (pirin superfamily)
MSVRGIRTIQPSQPTLEGAGVRLRRAFGFGETEAFDPFLLFDDFRGDRPADYQAGFPWHPHRGIETITYVLAGSVEHRDSLGNRGILKPGDIQWMTAGRGIIHQEMPEGNPQGQMHGFQLWANLPSSLKMTVPRYQDIGADAVPEAVEDDGTTVRVLCGSFWGKTGPVEGIAADPQYLDVWVPAGKTRVFPVSVDRHAFAYVFEGSGTFHEASSPQGVLTENLATDTVYRTRPVENRHLVLFDTGDEVRVTAGDRGLRFLLASGRPLGEPVAWHGPIVMNTKEQIRQALKDLDEGTFLGR